jgi:hypothetical protein
MQVPSLQRCPRLTLRSRQMCVPVSPTWCLRFLAQMLLGVEVLQLLLGDAAECNQQLLAKPELPMKCSNAFWTKKIPHFYRQRLTNPGQITTAQQPPRGAVLLPDVYDEVVLLLHQQRPC